MRPIWALSEVAARRASAFGRRCGLAHLVVAMCFTGLAVLTPRPAGAQGPSASTVTVNADGTAATVTVRSR